MSPKRLVLHVLALFAVGFVLMAVGLVAGQGAIVLGLLVWLVAFVWLVTVLARALVRRLLWRVGRRLLVSYLLLGVVPIPLVLALGWVLLYMLSGQLAARRVELELRRTVHAVSDVAEAVGPRLATLDDAEARRRAVDEHAAELPGLGYAYRPEAAADAAHGTEGEGPVDPGLLLPAGRVYTSLEAIGFLDDGRHFLAVLRPTDGGTLVLYQQLEPDLRERLERLTRVGLAFLRDGQGDNVHLTLDSGRGFNLEVREDEADGAETGEPGTAGAPADEPLEQEPAQGRDLELSPPVPVPDAGFFGRPWVFWPRMVQLTYVDWQAADWHAAVEGQDELFPYLVRTSIAREYVELFDTLGGDEANLEIARTAVGVLYALTGTTVVVYVLATLLAGLLVYRIAQATWRLDRGFAAVEAGDFEHRAKLRGRDQLAALVTSFNRMVEHLGEAVEERAEKEALERELELAPELQRSLLPPADFQAPGFEIATDFEPAAAIGGDFYHFVQRGEGRLAVIVADVSGHGLGTGIVMSAAKALVSALATDDAGAPAMLHRLDRELREVTGPRTFVTLCHCLFDLGRGVVEVTNAGHLPIYRLAAGGVVTSVASASLPLGTGLAAQYRTVREELRPGELWVLLSDGIVEARDEGGELFGFERFETRLAACSGLPASTALDRLLDSWRRFTGGDQPADDRTLLVIGTGAEPGGRDPGSPPART